jgi:hypothetical protein
VIPECSTTLSADTVGIEDVRPTPPVPHREAERDLDPGERRRPKPRDPASPDEGELTKYPPVWSTACRPTTSPNSLEIVHYNCGNIIIQPMIVKGQNPR